MVIWHDHGNDKGDTQPMNNLWWWSGVIMVMTRMVIWHDHGNDNGDTQPMNNLWWWSGVIMVMTMVIPSLWIICDRGDIAWWWYWQWWWLWRWQWLSLSPEVQRTLCHLTGCPWTCWTVWWSCAPSPTRRRKWHRWEFVRWGCPVTLSTLPAVGHGMMSPLVH